MICLHFSAHEENGEIMVTCDRLRREDANDKEQAIINMVHDGIALLLAMSPAAKGPPDFIVDPQDAGKR